MKATTALTVGLLACATAAPAFADKQGTGVLDQANAYTDAKVQAEANARAFADTVESSERKAVDNYEAQEREFADDGLSQKINNVAHKLESVSVPGTAFIAVDPPNDTRYDLFWGCALLPPEGGLLQASVQLPPGTHIAGLMADIMNAYATEVELRKRGRDYSPGPYEVVVIRPPSGAPSNTITTYHQEPPEVVPVDHAEYFWVIFHGGASPDWEPTEICGVTVALSPD
jgi:hypothetical protein